MVTADEIMAQMQTAMRDLGASPQPPSRIYVSEHATKKGRRLIKPSRYRSKRIWKKLLKRHGGEWERKPAIYQTPQGFVCHPALYAQLRERCAPAEAVMGKLGELRW